jgi:hypothetical protein
MGKGGLKAGRRYFPDRLDELVDFPGESGRIPRTTQA